MTKKQKSQVDECAWESGNLGLSEEHAVRMPPAHDQAVDDALALQLISIRLPKVLITDLKFIAAREGLGYQPLIRRVLQRFVAAEYRNMANDEFVTVSKVAAAEASSETESAVEPEPIRRRA